MNAVQPLGSPTPTTDPQKDCSDVSVVKNQVRAGFSQQNVLRKCASDTFAFFDLRRERNHQNSANADPPVAWMQLSARPSDWDVFRNGGQEEKGTKMRIFFARAEGIFVIRIYIRLRRMQWREWNWIWYAMASCWWLSLFFWIQACVPRAENGVGKLHTE